MFKFKLQDVANLQSGVYLKNSNDEENRTYLVGIKDFDDDLNFIGGSVLVNGSEVKEKYIIRESHVLFSTRLKFSAFELPEGKGTFVASNSFILIKPNTKKIYPGYLRWFLNHPNTQRDFLQIAQGSSRMPYLSEKKLGSLMIDLPELSIQKDIAAVYHLLKREKIISKKLTAKKEEYFQSILLASSKK